MRRVALRRILLVLLSTVLVLGTIGMPAAAQDAPDPDPTTVTTQSDDESVTELPATGRGQGLSASDTERFVAEQMLVTVLVLITAATLSLGAIALAWRYDRQ
ncbi:MAG TPA: hypothetical protein VGR22_10675 [Thermomicrobiales bacterium]|nr:hypothetical protein [Thermomicrobiales bacterium]